MGRSVGVILLLAGALPAAAGSPAVTFVERDGRLQIDVGGKPAAAYVFGDARVRRPYFTDLRTPAGVRVTRTYPPVEGKDDTDHATFHPGLWLAFGDLGGTDFWRNKAAVKHAGFVELPTGGAGSGGFAARNRYEADGRVVCEETTRLRVLVRPSAYLLAWDSTFQSGREFAFGDQEEMGLGVRVATPLAAKNGGRITDSAGRRDEKQVWGKAADWCAYTGQVGGKKVGVALLPHPDNFRPSWFHARGYGLLVANPFGRNAFTKGEPSRVVVRPGETFRLRFGVLVFDGDIDVNAAYRDYLKSAR